MSPPRALPGVPVTVERDVPCRLRDGVVLVADVYRPVEDGPWPVLLIRTPYGKTAAESDAGFAHPSWYARQGYMVVSQDTRGRGASEGVFEPFVHEAVDGYDAIEWAARLNGADGRVGTYGFSYPGLSQLLAAALRPPSLVTISPAFTAPQAYDGWVYRGGALSLAFAASWALDLASETARRSGDEAAVQEIVRSRLGVATANWSLPLAAHPAADAAPFYRDWLEHSTLDDTWSRTAADADWSRIEVPALHVGGWWDVFVAGTVRSFVGLTAAARAPQKLLLGPWAHAPWQPLDAGAVDAGGSVVDDWQLRWFDQHLRGCETDVLAAPVTAHVAGAGWRELAGWPPPSSHPVEWFLHSAGRANSASGDGVLSLDPPADEPPDVFVYNPAYPTPSLGGHSCCDQGSAPIGPACQAAAESLTTVLVYTSSPLEHDLELLGDVEATVYAASTAVDTDFTARLCVVDVAGTSRNVQEGIRRARFRDSLTAPAPLVPGTVYPFRIALGPVALRIPAGARLRLDVSSSDFPQWDRNLNTGGRHGHEGLSHAMVATQVVLHDRSHPSRLTLPVNR